jgi:hypothetical protein
MPDGVVHFRNDIYGLDGLDQLASDTPASVAATPLGDDQTLGKTTQAVQTQTQ